jgi:hypothetical protein
VFLRNNFLGKKPASQTPAYLALSFFTFAFPAGCSAKLKRIGQDWLPAWREIRDVPTTPPILARFLASWCHARILTPLAPRSMVIQPFEA